MRRDPWRSGATHGIQRSQDCCLLPAGRAGVRFAPPPPKPRRPFFNDNRSCVLDSCNQVRLLYACIRRRGLVSAFFPLSCATVPLQLLSFVENMATNKKTFSLEGKGLKLDTAEDLEPHIAGLKAMDDVEEVRILGNTLGVGACKRLGEVLSTKKSLQVCLCPRALSTRQKATSNMRTRSPTSPTSSPAVS